MMQPTQNESHVHTDELVDIREVSVDKNLPKEERIAAFIRQKKILTASAAAILW